MTGDRQARRELSGIFRDVPDAMESDAMEEADAPACVVCS